VATAAPGHGSSRSIWLAATALPRITSHEDHESREQLNGGLDNAEAHSIVADQMSEQARPAGAPAERSAPGWPCCTRRWSGRSSASWARTAATTRTGRPSVTGITSGEVTLGGRRVAISRPRVRTADDTAEIALDSYEEFASRDQLEQVILERMLAGVSTRPSRRVADPVGEQIETVARSTSKSAVSRSFVAKRAQRLRSCWAAICLSWSWRW
jgi:hypothetical protein